MHQQELKHQLGDRVIDYMRANRITLDEVADKVISVCSDTSRKGVINRLSGLRGGVQFMVRGIQTIIILLVKCAKNF